MGRQHATLKCQGWFLWWYMTVRWSVLECPLFDVIAVRSLFNRATLHSHTCGLDVMCRVERKLGILFRNIWKLSNMDKLLEGSVFAARLRDLEILSALINFGRPWSSFHTDLLWTILLLLRIPLAAEWSISLHSVLWRFWACFKCDVQKFALVSCPDEFSKFREILKTECKHSGPWRDQLC